MCLNVIQMSLVNCLFIYFLNYFNWLFVLLLSCKNTLMMYFKDQPFFILVKPSISIFLSLRFHVFVCECVCVSVCLNKSLPIPRSRIFSSRSFKVLPLGLWSISSYFLCIWSEVMLKVNLFQMNIHLFRHHFLKYELLSLNCLDTIV